jgi:hypothetical protein
MTSSDSATEGTQPQEARPPELLPPWRTPEREQLQLQARRFAMDEVLPVANELDPRPDRGGAPRGHPGDQSPRRPA